MSRPTLDPSHPLIQREPWAIYLGWSVRSVKLTTHLHTVPTYKDKSVPLQAWSGPEGSRKLRFPDLMTTAQGGGKVVSRTHRLHLPPGNSPGTHFC